MKRGRITISLSQKNPHAIAIMEAIKDIPARQRSVVMLRWAASYLSGKQREVNAISVSDFDDEELDAALDDW
jgi:hypothetical protein